jgi:predicted chitinase
MSNNDKMDVEQDRGHGLRAPNKKNEGHGVRGHIGGSRVASENEREKGHLKQWPLQVHTGNRNTDDHKKWTKVGGRTKGGNQKDNYTKQDKVTELGLDWVASTAQVTTKNTTAASSETAMVTDWDEMLIEE